MQDDKPSFDSTINSANEELGRAIKNGSVRGSGRNMPYYKPVFADMVMHAIDYCTTSRAPLTWPASGISLNSLYLRWRQGSQYVKDCYPESDIKKLDQVTAHKVNDVGLVIRPRPALVAIDSNDINWHSDFEKFIEESGPGEHFERIGILFHPEDKTYITRILTAAGLDKFVMDFQADKLLIVRI